MTKSDKSLHSICVRSIKRRTISPYDFKWTKLYETNSDFTYTGLQIDLAEDELIICSTIIDKDNYSILTTRRLLTKQDGQLSTGNIQNAIYKLYGDFKGYRNKTYTLGQILLQDGNELKCFIETGKASMVIIQGVRTLIGATRIANK
jgi:hypothetical protein